MAKTKKDKTVEITVNGKNFDSKALLAIVDKNEYEIIGATTKDDFCNYQVRILKGQMKDETSTHDGPLIISDDLRNAMQRLRKHLAWLDDAFENQDVNQIEDIENTLTTDKYDVTAFKIKRADENIQVKLTGSKYLSSCSGRMTCNTPFILLDAGTDYKWYNELLTDILICQREVALYKEGKGMHPEQPEKKAKVKQLKITDGDQPVNQEEPAEA